MFFDFKRADAQQQIVWGELYAPGYPDTHMTFMSAETIQDLAYTYLAGLSSGEIPLIIDVEHDYKPTSCRPVESFIARDGDPSFIPGAWVIAVHIDDPELWEKVQNNTFNGFSIAGESYLRDVEVEVEIPDIFTGETLMEDGHTHTFSFSITDDGKVTNGSTNEVNGHSHVIDRWCLTDDVAGHAHRYSVQELLNGVT